MTTLQNWPRTLLTLTLSTALLLHAPNAHAQNSSVDYAQNCGEMARSLDEMTSLANAFADQRDRALKLAEKNRTERDVCEGRLAEVDAVAKGLQVTVREYERVIAQHEAKVSPWVWYAAGVATPVVMTGLGLLVWLAVK